MSRRGTLVYVHGASDRAAQVADHVTRIEQQLQLAGMDFAVIASRWGEAAGADLSKVDLAVPALDGRGLAPPTPPQPLAELGRLAATAEPRAVAAGALGSPAMRMQSDELLDICRTQVGAPGESITRADGTQVPMAAACRGAAVSVAASPEYAAARAADVPETLLVGAVGRAVVATVAVAAAAPQDVARTVEVRIAEAVLGAALATVLAGYLGIDVGPDLKRWATDVLVPHRARLIREAGLGPADVVLYQRNGGPIRRFVAATIAEAISRGGPVVVLGNSLGGIVAVDALAEADGPRPDLLVTVGSQAPLLATFGALEPLGRDGSPAPFQPWLNIHDRRDLLGFVAQRVWPDQSGITDVEVDLDLGFPDAHGAAYLGHPQVYEAIRAHPALADPGGGSAGRRFQVDVRRLSPALRYILGVEGANSAIQVDGGLLVSFGRLAVQVPLSNVASWQLGPVRRGGTLLGVLGSIVGRRLELGDGDAGVTFDLNRPLPWVLLGPRSLSVAVQDAGALGRWLTERGVPRGS